MNQDNDGKVFLNAAQQLVNAAIEAARAESPADFAALAGVMQAGGLLKLVSVFAPLTQQCLLQIEIVEPSGTGHTLMQCNLERSTLQ